MNQTWLENLNEFSIDGDDWIRPLIEVLALSMLTLYDGVCWAGMNPADINPKKLRSDLHCNGLDQCSRCEIWQDRFQSERSRTPGYSASLVCEVCHLYEEIHDHMGESAASQKLRDLAIKLYREAVQRRENKSRHVPIGIDRR